MREVRKDAMQLRCYDEQDTVLNTLKILGIFENPRRRLGVAKAMIKPCNDFKVAYSVVSKTNL
jgi:hypothetical protein